MLRLLVSIAFVVTLGGVAFSQAINVLGDRPKPRLTAEDVAKQKADEEAYQAGLKKIPDAKASKDPWGNVRATGAADAKPKK